MRKGTTALMMFVIGAAAGGVAALLLAPERGRTTRRKLRRGVEDIVEKGRDWVDETGQGLRGRAGSVTTKFRRSDD